MARKNRSEQESYRVASAREMEVYKRDDMIQKARYKLTLQEQKCVLFAISKIKPDDKGFNEYIFELKDFYAICGLQKESYTELKAILKGLSDRSWWAEIDDKGTESVLRWFTTVRTNKRSGKVTIKFHEDMMPFLLQLAAQDAFYTGFELQYVLPMNSQYGPRLYEILKSYQKNQWRWFFELDKLRHLLNCDDVLQRWPDFRRFALEPAVQDINQYTDLKIAWDVQRNGKKVTRVEFYMVKKGTDELLETQRTIIDALDGQMTMDEQMAQLHSTEETVMEKFKRENSPGRKKRPSEDS